MGTSTNATFRRLASKPQHTLLSLKGNNTEPLRRQEMALQAICNFSQLSSIKLWFLGGQGPVSQKKSHKLSVSGHWFINGRAKGAANPISPSRASKAAGAGVSRHPGPGRPRAPAGRGPRRRGAQWPRGGGSEPRSRGGVASGRIVATRGGAEPRRHRRPRRGPGARPFWVGRACPRAVRCALTGQAGGPAAAVPMGLCLPCLGEPEPPSPDPVSKAASARRRPRRAHLFAGRAPREGAGRGGPAPREGAGGSRRRGHPAGRLDAGGARRRARGWAPRWGRRAAAPRGTWGVLPAAPGPPPPWSPHFGYIQIARRQLLGLFRPLGPNWKLVGPDAGGVGGGPFLATRETGVQMKCLFFPELERCVF